MLALRQCRVHTGASRAVVRCMSSHEPPKKICGIPGRCVRLCLRVVLRVACTLYLVLLCLNTSILGWRLTMSCTCPGGRSVLVLCVTLVNSQPCAYLSLILLNPIHRYASAVYTAASKANLLEKVESELLAFAKVSQNNKMNMLECIQ
jgi:hypothetical protein